MGFSHLFVRERLEDVRYTGNSLIDDARNVRDYIFTKVILLAKSVKISSHCLYGSCLLVIKLIP